MNWKITKKGTIIVAIVFILCIAACLAAVIGLFRHKTPLVVSRLKRFQAINHAEAALYETFNRFRTGYPGWDPASWPGEQEITIDGVSVKINVEWDAGVGRTKVSATVD
jgi:hypothetical protein